MLPPYHVPRRRLTDAQADARVVVVEAGAGFGKTTLGAEFVEAWRSVGIEAVLVNPGSPAGLLAARLHSAVRRAGYVEAAAGVTAAGEDAQATVENLIDALSSERCTFVIDDAHHADRSAAVLIHYLVAHLRGEQRAVILSRHLPPGAERLRRGEFTQLAGSELSLTTAETEAICRDGFGLDIDGADLEAVERATAGWTAATVLAAARSQRTGEPLAQVAKSATAVGSASGSVVAILDEAMSGLDERDRSLLAQLSRLPRIDRTIVETVAGAGSAERFLAAGVPLSVGAEYWEIPGPVRDVLTSLAPPDPRALRRAAEQYRKRGDVAAALQLLAAHGLDVDAAQVLADTEYRHLETLDVLELCAVVDALSAKAIEEHPGGLLKIILACSAASLPRARAKYLERAQEVAARRDDPAFDRGVRLELAKDAVIRGDFAEAEVMARAILAEATSFEAVTRAGAYGALGRAVCWRETPEGARDLVALDEADRYLATASATFLELGMPGVAALASQYQAYWIDFAKGNPAAGLARLAPCLQRVVDRPRIWGSLMNLRFEMELELGRFEDCEASAAETLRVASQVGDLFTRNYIAWNLALMHSFLGDRDATVAELHRCEAEAGEWWAAAGADFLATAIECSGRIGEAALAFDYLERAKDDVMNAGQLIALAEAVLLARFGDPEAAEAKLVELRSAPIDPRETWRVTLFRALAAFRQGDPAAGALAGRAFEEAAKIGLPEVPLVREREVTLQLLGLALETGLPAAAALGSVTMPVAVRVLGGFAVTNGGRDTGLPAGLGAQVVKLLAVSGGRLVTEQLIFALWPDADLDQGRHRLRTILSRLRADAGDVVQRDGEVLMLAPGVAVDLAEFEREARRALALGRAEPLMAAAVARSAIARYRGELLPEDPYVPWATGPRESARRLVLQLLDLCADAATSRGDLDEVRRVVEMTIDLAPYDDERYLRAAATLLSQGRRGAALTVVRRARSALDELGLPPSDGLVRLEEQIVA
jgi:DNA-binding SARP family transcriptional activator/ATP/maltotriose-dependent transcriptional regulator MalT